MRIIHSGLKRSISIIMDYLVWFDGIWNILSYSMPNPFYTYIRNTYNLWTYFLHKTLKWELSLFFLHTVKSFQVLQCITNYSIKHQSFVYTQLKVKTVLFLTIQFSISHLFAHSLNMKLLFDPLMGPYQVLPLQARVDQEQWK